MQPKPKSTMTFRFDRPPSAPRPLPEKPRSASPERPEHTRAPQAGQARGGAAAPRPDAYAGGPLQDDPYTLEAIIRGAGELRVPGTEMRSEVPIRDRQLDRPVLPDLTDMPDMPEWLNSQQPPDVSRPIDMPALPETDASVRRDDRHAEAARRSDAEPASGWNAEPTGPIVEAFPVLRKGSVRAGGPSWWRVFASVAGAIATGALFGYLVLSLFTGEETFPSPVGTAAETAAPAVGPVQAGAGGASADPAGDETAAGGAPTASAAASQEDAPAGTYYLLQYGVFRSQDSVDAALAQLKDRGLPGTVDSKDGYRVYLGAAGTKEEAELLSAQLTGLEVYVKTAEAVSVPAGATVPAGAASAFAARSGELIRALSRLSVDALQDEMPQPFPAKPLASLRAAHARWLQAAEGADRLDGAARESAQALMQALEAAMASVDDYGRGVSRYHLWHIQADVTKAAIEDRAMRAALAGGETAVAPER